MELFSPSPRQSVCELEADACSEFILNIEDQLPSLATDARPGDAKLVQSLKPIYMEGLFCLYLTCQR